MSQEPVHRNRVSSACAARRSGRTTAAKSASMPRPVTTGVDVIRSSRPTSTPVDVAMKISPLPWCATEPVRANPSPIRRANRAHPAPSAGASPESPDAAVTQRRHDGRESRKLGTGHGRRLDSGAAYTDFLRASEEPDEVIRIYYDSRRNLLARGIIPRPYDRYAVRQPDPFPSAFVPDP